MLMFFFCVRETNDDESGIHLRLDELHYCPNHLEFLLCDGLCVLCMQICQTIELWYHLRARALCSVTFKRKRSTRVCVCVDRLDGQANDLPILGSFRFHWFCEFVQMESYCVEE